MSTSVVEDVAASEQARGREANPTSGRQRKGQDKSRDVVSAMETGLTRVEVAVADTKERLDQVEQSVEDLDGQVGESPRCFRFLFLIGLLLLPAY